MSDWGNERDRVKNLGSGAGTRGWKKGQSGNPGGRPKGEQAARRIAAQMIAEKTDGGREIIEFTIRVLRGNENGCDDSKSRRWAADWLADRLWGKAMQTVEVGPVTESDAVPNVREMTLEELRKMAAGEDGSPPDDIH